MAGGPERTLRQGEDHHEFLEHVKLEMFADQVFCFTPKGDVIKLPKGATPIDFAYAIHTRIGESCVGAKIDGRRVPLVDTAAERPVGGDHHRRRPAPPGRLDGHRGHRQGRAAIRRALREEHRDRYVKLGRELARVALEHVGKKPPTRRCATAARNLGLRDDIDLLAQLGSAELSGKRWWRRSIRSFWTNRSAPRSPARAVVGLTGDQTSQRAACCQPVPGERIVGITTRGHGVLIHARHRLPALVDVEDQPDRWVDVHWQPGRHEAGLCRHADRHAVERCGCAGPHLHPDRRAERQHLEHSFHRPQARFLSHAYRCRSPRYRASLQRHDGGGS
jgi:guanosine-3',5'-bis(diphosphate) 3'-pyrophosphohydrolase